MWWGRGLQPGPGAGGALARLRAIAPDPRLTTPALKRRGAVLNISETVTDFNEIDDGEVHIISATIPFSTAGGAI